MSEPDGLEWLHERRGVFLKSKKDPPSDFFFVTAQMKNVRVPVRAFEDNLNFPTWKGDNLDETLPVENVAVPARTMEEKFYSIVYKENITN